MGEQAEHLRGENTGNDENMDSENENMIEEEEEDDGMSPEEFEALNSQMDELNSALDSIEQRNDDIYSKLLKLLEANRETREQLQKDTQTPGEASAVQP